MSYDEAIARRKKAIEEADAAQKELERVKRDIKITVVFTIEEAEQVLGELRYTGMRSCSSYRSCGYMKIERALEPFK